MYLCTTSQVYPCIIKLQTTRPKSGEDDLKVIVEEARRIEADLQIKSGVVVVQDQPNTLHWEETYYTLTMEDDLTPPPVDPIEPASGLHHDKPGSVIDLTVSASEPCRKKPGPIIDLTASDEGSPPAPRIHPNTEVTIKQEIDDSATAKVVNKGRGAAKRVKDGATSGGSVKVATKIHRHGDGNGTLKTTKAETILANIADGLSAEAQEKRELSHVNLLRESMDQERRDRMVDERVHDLRLEIQGLKKEIDDLRHENAYHRDRATEAVTMLGVLTGTSRSFMPVRNPLTAYTPAMPAFSTDPSPYSVPLTKSQSPEPEGIAGPGPQTMHNRQQGAEVDNSEIAEGE